MGKRTHVCCRKRVIIFIAVEDLSAFCVKLYIMRQRKKFYFVKRVSVRVSFGSCKIEREFADTAKTAGGLYTDFFIRVGEFTQ